MMVATHKYTRGECKKEAEDTQPLLGTDTGDPSAEPEYRHRSRLTLGAGETR